MICQSSDSFIVWFNRSQPCTKTSDRHSSKCSEHTRHLKVDTTSPILQIRKRAPREHRWHRADLLFRLRPSWFRVQLPDCYCILFFKGQGEMKSHENFTTDWERKEESVSRNLGDKPYLMPLPFLFPLLSPWQPSDRFWNMPGSSLLQRHSSCCYFYLEQFSQSMHGSFSSFKYWVICQLLRKKFPDDPDRIAPLNSTPSYHHFYSFF